MNIQISEQIIKQLVYCHGVQTFCLCPGGRNAPLVKVMSHTKGLNILSFFDERSAGFFALGCAKKEGRPVAVITTSGTAVAELLPSVIEAYYSHTPLALITADRPSSYRGTGSPQSIEQKGIFTHYVEKEWDLNKTLDFDLSDWPAHTPCHINVCFDEPLINKEPSSLDFSDFLQSTFLKGSALEGSRATDKDLKHKGFNQLNPTDSEKKEQKQMLSFFQKCQKPLCILAELPQTVRQDVENILGLLGWPVYAEALSHLQESQKLFLLRSGEGILNQLVLDKKIDGILRIGRRPTTRFWRDLNPTSSGQVLPFVQGAALDDFSTSKVQMKHKGNKTHIETSYSHLPVLSVSDQTYAGLSHREPAISFKTFFAHKVGDKVPPSSIGCDSVLRNGTTLEAFPTSRVHKKQKVHALGLKQGASKTCIRFLESEKKAIAKIDKDRRKHFIQTLNKHPLSEMALIKSFFEKIPTNSLLFLGNSLPIREWDQVASYGEPHKNLKYIANRGANGIDGLISTFLGACELDRTNFCLVGDLSALYDLSALWIFNQLNKTCFARKAGDRVPLSSIDCDSVLTKDKGVKHKTFNQLNLKPACFIVVVNNQGGRIFSSLFSDPMFINAHNLSFKKWAEMWNFHYYGIKKWPDQLSFLSPAIIELKVDPKNTKLFEQEVALNFLSVGLDLETVSKCTGFSIEKIKKLKNSSCSK